MTSASFGDRGWTAFTEALRRFLVVLGENIETGQALYSGSGEPFGVLVLRGLTKNKEENAKTDLITRLRAEVAEIAPFWKRLERLWFIDRYESALQRCKEWHADYLQRSMTPGATFEDVNQFVDNIHQLGAFRSAAVTELLEDIRRRPVFSSISSAAKTALGLSANACTACGTTGVTLRIWLDGPEPPPRFCAQCIAAKGIERIDKEKLPSLLPELIAESAVGEPGPGGEAFSTALAFWNRGQRDQAATEYERALAEGLSSAYEAAARSNLGQILLDRDDRESVRKAVQQFMLALYASPQTPMTLSDSARRLAIMLDESGATALAKKASLIAQKADAQLNSSLSQAEMDRVRQIVRKWKDRKKERCETPGE
jgi:tetratricopeptide (TPR) repeat protein